MKIKHKQFDFCTSIAQKELKMTIPRHYVEEAKKTLAEIDSWFETEVKQNPQNAISLVAQRAKKINGEIYENFANQRELDIEKERDVNSIKLYCRAGRARPFGSIPTASSSGRVRRDDSDWIYESHRVRVNNTNKGAHSVSVLEDKSGCNFQVRCTGVAFENTRHGHGWHDATLLVTFKMTEEAIGNEVRLEWSALQRELGL